MLGAVELLWIVLTLVVSSINLVALVQPNWILNPYTYDCFGPLTVCSTAAPNYLFHFQRRICNFHDDKHVYLQYPSLTWQFVAVVYTMSTVLMLISATVALFGVLLLEKHVRDKIASAASYTQGIAVLLSLVTVSTFPLLLSNHRAKTICSMEASIYYLSGCQLGWSYMLAIAGTAIGAFCPYLAQHTDIMLEGIDSMDEFREAMDIRVEDCLVFEGPIICPSETKTSVKSSSTVSSFLNV